MLFKIWVFVVLLTLVGFVEVDPQSLRGERDLVIVKPRPCEFNNLVLEDAHRRASQNSLVILIAIRGINDSDEDVSARRLHTARVFLTEYFKLRSEDTLVTAVARNSERYKFGGLQIYINGRLFDILTSYKNGDLSVGSCDAPDSDDKNSREMRKRLYPWVYGSGWTGRDGS